MKLILKNNIILTIMKGDNKQKNGKDSIKNANKKKSPKNIL